MCEKRESHCEARNKIYFQERMNAEYTFGTTFSPKAAADAIQKAEAFFEVIAALLSP